VVKMGQKTLGGKVLPLRKPQKRPLAPIFEQLENALPLLEEGCYKKAKIPKGRGGWREICIPSSELKKIQKRIILPYLRKIVTSVWAMVFGLYGGSYIGHAKRHAESRFILSLDMKDAFPSTTSSQLQGILFDLIYRNMVSGVYKFAESLEEIEEEYTKNKKLSNRLAGLITRFATFENGLPQGASTSPLLFYIYLDSRMRVLLSKIWNILRKFRSSGWQMSCYVDNFAISSNRWIPPDIRKEIIMAFEEVGLKLNQKKIKFHDCRHGAVMITGIRVDGQGKISLPKKTIRKWRGIIGRARFDPENLELRQKVEGFIASLKPIYEEGLPPQIAKPYNRYQQALVKITS